MHRVAVYGTLKKGFVNHGLLRKAKWLGAGVTTNSYVMKNHEGRYPALMMTPEPLRLPVMVEVYEVDDDTLKALDGLEGVPNLYTREEVTIELYVSHQEYTEPKVDAFIYMGVHPTFGRDPAYKSDDGCYDWQERKLNDNDLD